MSVNFPFRLNIIRPKKFGQKKLGQTKFGQTKLGQTKFGQTKFGQKNLVKQNSANCLPPVSFACVSRKKVLIIFHRSSLCQNLAKANSFYEAASNFVY